VRAVEAGRLRHEYPAAALLANGWKAFASGEQKYVSDMVTVREKRVLAV